MKRLGILYPPCGAELEYYQHGERLGADVRISLMGVRIYGGDDEHAPEHLSRTGSLDNLALSARVMAPLAPDAVIWACTSGSFVDGPAHARAQVEALAAAIGCPATSTSLAFVAALAHLGVREVSVLASYPEATAARFFALLAESGIDTRAYRCLDIDSGPAAAGLSRADASAACRELEIAEHAALLIPDTAIPTMHWIEPLERELGRPGEPVAHRAARGHCARPAAAGAAFRPLTAGRAGPAGPARRKFPNSCVPDKGSFWF